MKFGRSRPRTGHDVQSWPVLLLLLIVVLVPTASVLWFMTQAMRNEQLAVRQKLADVYRAELHELQKDLQLVWQTRSQAMDVQEPGLPSSRVFAERVREAQVDSVVVYDTSGQPAYPTLSRTSGSLPPSSGEWRRAERLERGGQSRAAAQHYAEIATSATDRNLAAQALQAQARCLVQAGDSQAAISILVDEISRPEYDEAVDPQGRFIAPNSLLRALQLLDEGTSPLFQRTVTTLQQRLSNYDHPTLPAAQRRFLMRELGALAPSAPTFSTLAAEELAQRYLESTPPAPATTSLQASGIPEVWHLAAPSGSLVALFHQGRLVQDFETLIAQRTLPKSTRIEFLPPGVEAEDLFLVSLPVGGFLQGWQLVLRPEDQQLFTNAANQQINVYLLIGALVVVVIFFLAILVARLIARQLHLTRLKNDLLATVSHELKTPLASIRLLVDTLLETGLQDTQRVQEYLQLIGKENVRLSRLVDNFLTFSRMEQNRQSFDKKPISPAEVVAAAVDSVSERFHATGCRFEVHNADDLPDLVADHDALVTVLLNLLDNAEKYSHENKHIILRSFREQEHICFAVQDHGIGLSSRESGKIFDRFYQVDQSLSRPGSGCGLGLSIVQFIVKAHGGSVDVQSQAGEGSTFTVRLPIDEFSNKKLS